MTAVYVFCAAIGVPLLAFFLFAGDTDGGDGGGGDFDGADVGNVDGGDLGGSHIWSDVAQVIPISSIAIALSGFGVTGLLLDWTGSSAAVTLVLALVVALVAGALNSTLFSWLRRSSSSSHTEDRQFEGLIGRTSVPITAGQRGRIVVESNGHTIALTARPYLADALPMDVGSPVLIVSIDNGVALVSPIDQELT